MTNPEHQPLYISYGVKQKDLVSAVGCATEIFAKITDSAMPEWVFHPSRIQNELNQGRKKLDVKIQTARGAMTLSIEKNGGYLNFALDANKYEKPENLLSHYEAMEQQFDKDFFDRLRELGMDQEILNL